MGKAEAVRAQKHVPAVAAMATSDVQRDMSLPPRREMSLGIRRTAAQQTLYFGETSLPDPITAGETSWSAFAVGTKGPQCPHRTLVWKAFPLSMLMAFQTFQCEMRGRL